MENEQRKYWFFGSKLNTALLLVLIILMVIAIRIMLQNKEAYLPIMNQVRNIPLEDKSYGEDTPNSYDNIATLDLSDEYTKTYKTVFTEALKKPADFYWHYVVASYGCGSGCITYGVVDKLTGRAYKGPTDDYANNYPVPSDFDTQRYSFKNNLFKVHGYNEIETYKFENNQFTLIK